MNIQRNDVTFGAAINYKLPECVTKIDYCSLASDCAIKLPKKLLEGANVYPTSDPSIRLVVNGEEQRQLVEAENNMLKAFSDFRKSFMQEGDKYDFQSEDRQMRQVIDNYIESNDKSFLPSEKLRQELVAAREANYSLKNVSVDTKLELKKRLDIFRRCENPSGYAKFEQSEKDFQNLVDSIANSKDTKTIDYII